MPMDPIDPAFAQPGDSDLVGAQKTVAVISTIEAALNMLIEAARSTGPVTNLSPIAGFTVAQQNGNQVQLKSNAVDPDGSIASTSWDFGDGMTGTGSTVTHTYAIAGDYTVIQTVTDNGGATDSTSRDLTIAGSVWFTIGAVKPTSSNTGAGVLRAYPSASTGTLTGTQTLTGSTVMQGKVINGNVNIGGTARLVDCIVNGLVKCTDGTPLIENCVVQGDGTTTYVGTDGRGLSTWLVDTRSKDLKLATVRFTTIRGRVHSNGLNGIGLKNFLAEYCDISCVVDCCDIDGTSAGSDGTSNATLQGCYLHDMIWYPNDPGHSLNGTAINGDGTYTGTWAGVSSDHADGIQITGAAKNPKVIGNTIRGSWSSDPAVSSLPLMAQSGKTIFMQLSALMLNSVQGLQCTDNWLEGGDYCVNGGGAASGSSGDFARNRFDRSMSPHGLSSTTPFTLVLKDSGNAWTTHDGTSDQNTFQDTGSAITVRHQ